MCRGGAVVGKQRRRRRQPAKKGESGEKGYNAIKIFSWISYSNSLLFQAHITTRHTITFMLFLLPSDALTIIWKINEIFL